jgi:putative endonuclease
MSENYTYILQCGDGTLYTGWTNDMQRRLQAHKSGQGAKYTRGRGPFTLVYLEQSDSRQQAMSREARIKRLNRKEKLELIRTQNEKQQRLIRQVEKQVTIHGLSEY